MGLRWSLVIACAVGVAIWLAAPISSAQQGGSSSADSAAAQVLWDEARELIKQGDHEAAYPKFEESNRLDPQLGTLMNVVLGKCFFGLGHLTDGTFQGAFFRPAPLQDARLVQVNVGLDETRSHQVSSHIDLWSLCRQSGLDRCDSTAFNPDVEQSTAFLSGDQSVSQNEFHRSLPMP